MHQIGKYFILTFLALCIFCTTAVTTKAQDGIHHTKLPVDTVYAQQYVGVAESLIKIGRVDSALQYVEDAASIYKNVKAWKRCAEAYNQIGFELYRINKYEEAYHLFSNAYNVAEKHLPEHNATLATSSNHLGVIYTLKGNYERALSFHNKALAIQENLWGANHEALVKTYLNLGSVFYSKGEFQKSLNYNKKAFNIQQLSTNTSESELAETFNNIGLLYLRLENFDAALDNYKKSLAIKQKIYFASHPKIATTFTDLALNYQKLGLFSEALKASDNALIILNNTFEKNHPDFGVNYQLKGDIHFEQADYKEAIDFYKKTLDNRLSGNIEGGAEIAETYLRIAKTYEEQKYNPMSILPYIQKAIQALVYQFDEDDIFENPSLNNILSNEYLLEAVQYKALMFKHLYNETGNVNHLEASLSSYQLATDLLLKIALQYKIDNRKPITPQLAKSTFESGAKTAYQLSKMVKAAVRSKYNDAGFQFSEQYKKYQQLIVLKSGTIKKFKGLEESSLNQEKQIKIDLDFYTQMLLEEYQKGELSNNNTISHLQKHIESLQSAYQELKEKYRTQFPDYYYLKYELATIGIKQLQSYLKGFLPQTALIAYFMGDSLGYSYSVTKDTSFVKEFLVDASLKNNIKDLTTVLSDYELLTEHPDLSYQKYATNAYAVFRSILSKALKPIESKVTQLVVLRDGDLHQIPFEPLLTGVDDRQTPFNELQYLVKTHTLSYAFSATHFLQDMRKVCNESDAYLGMYKEYDFAEMRKSDNENLVKLASSSKHEWANMNEILEPLNLFQKKNILTNKEKLTKKYFLQIARNYQVAHLAIIGYLSDTLPLNSALLFTPENKDEEFGYLKLSDLYTSNLNFDLLVLNGFVNLPSNNQIETISSLQQALSYAGCLSTLTNTWESEPNAVKELMSYFYQNLQQGVDKAEALTMAKRTLINQKTEQSHPYFWSSHLLLGNPQTIKHPVADINWTWWAIAGGGLLLLLFIIWIGTNFVKNRRNSDPQPNSTYKETSSTFSNQASTSAMTSTNVASSNGDRKLASFTRFKKD